jgi:hypothetical protein
MDSTGTGTDETDDLGKEVRQSLLLLGISLGVTVAVTAAAQATLSLLG